MDTKPTFILFFGTGWAGTTSICETLRVNYYFHPGYKKENMILYRLNEWNQWGFLEPDQFFSDRRFKTPIVHPERLKKARESRNGTYKGSKKEEMLLGHLKQSTEDSILGPFPSLKDYVEFYRELSEVIKPYYQATGDFSNPNGFLPDDFLVQVKQALEPYFNIKTFIIFRDPVRRLFSNVNHNFFVNHVYKEKSVIEAFSNEIKNSHLNTHQDYAYMVERLRRIFGDTEYLIMEDFFKENYRGEVEKLERYLDYKLPIITKCYFVPDKGINVQEGDPNLEDQWGCDREILTPELYTEARQQLSKIYDKFETLHGFLPADWGEPIDYGY
ncbi:MAG: hypothetical protein ACFFEY_19830 [Candidatus Thorarchaeota archaeon]